MNWQMKRAGIVLVALLLAPPAFGCMVCVGKPLKFAFQDSKLFFIGTVVERQARTVTFRVEEQFKGEPAAEVTLQTSSSCSMSQFETGASYLVEATEEGDGLEAYLCSHTQKLVAGGRDVEIVRKRARWWKSRLSRVSWYRLRNLIARQLSD